MKKILLSLILLLSVLIINAQQVKKQSRKERRAAREAQKIKEVKALLDNKTWIFDVNQAIPLAGQPVNVSGSFDARITNDTIISYLPFFGVGYVGDFGRTEGPFDFTQKIENYSFKTTKKGYQIKFDVRNKNDYLSFFFHIGKTGSATLDIHSRNRQAMSFYGDIEKVEDE